MPFTSFQDFRNNEETSRVGSKWTLEEDNQLQQAIKNSTPYDIIALEHKRTAIGIKSRVISSIIYPLYKKGTSIQQLATEYRIDEDTINKYITKAESNKTDQPVKNNINHDKKMNLIIEKLSYLENRTNEIYNKLDSLFRMNELNNKLDMLLSNNSMNTKNST